MPKLLNNFFLFQRFLQKARKFFFIKTKIIKGYFRAFIRTLYITFPYLFILKKTLKLSTGRSTKNYFYFGRSTCYFPGRCIPK